MNTVLNTTLNHKSWAHWFTHCPKLKMKSKKTSKWQFQFPGWIRPFMHCPCFLTGKVSKVKFFLFHLQLFSTMQGLNNQSVFHLKSGLNPNWTQFVSNCITLLSPARLLFEEKTAVAKSPNNKDELKSEQIEGKIQVQREEQPSKKDPKL